MIQIEKLSYGVPEKDLYREISFSIKEQEHVAFIGSNGTGKTTLVDMIMNPDEYLFNGKLLQKEGLKIGYVNQYVEHDKSDESTVVEYLSKDFEEMLKEQEVICEEMATATDYEEIMERYQQSLDAFAAVDGDNYETNIKKQLKLTGLTKVSDVPVSNISGGEYKLVQIIRQMMRNPGILIMDEPDVFLDFQNLLGLRELILQYPGTILVITHNRYLLNHCFNKILHLENMDIQEFEGSYPEYQVALLSKKVELQIGAMKDAAEIERQKKIMQKAVASATFVDDAGKGRQVKARKSLVRHLEERAIKEPFVEIRQPEISLCPLKQQENAVAEVVLSEVVLSVKDYSVAFEETLLQDVNFEIKAGEKVALVGENGTGKTTLLRDVYKQAKKNCKVGYLSQVYDDFFDPNETVADVLDRLGIEVRSEMESFLAKYCFPKEMLDERIKVLSGGEKNLLQIAMIQLAEYDILLLDEPTSHLDTYAQLALEKAVREYPGAILMVSHDFYVVAGCAEQVLFVENKTIRRMSSRAFRKMIYKNYFSSEYMELDKQKKEMEQRIGALLREKDTDTAEELCGKLEEIVQRMTKL